MKVWCENIYIYQFIFYINREVFAESFAKDYHWHFKIIWTMLKILYLIFYIFYFLKDVKLKMQMKKV